MILKKTEPLWGIIIFILIWVVIVELWKPFFLVSPITAFLTLIKLLLNSSFYNDISSTILGSILGLCFGCLIGISSGLILGYFIRSYRMISVVIDFLRSIPATSLFPLFIIIFGIGIQPKVALITFSITWIMLVNSVYGVRYSSVLRRRIAILHGAGLIQLFRHVILPDAIPHIYAGLRIAASTSLILMITFEMFFGSNSGLGNRIYESSQTYRLDELYSTIFAAGCIGYSLNKLIILFEKKHVHWV